MTPREILALCREKEVKAVDLRFMDFPGMQQHFTVPAHCIEADTFKNGLGFDGSSIRGWQAINESDMLVIPDPATAIGEMRRVLRPSGRVLLLDHVASTWWPIRAGQRMLERLTVPTAGEHFTRRQLPLVVAAGLVVEETQRLKAGTVERIAARKPADG